MKQKKLSGNLSKNKSLDCFTNAVLPNTNFGEILV